MSDPDEAQGRDDLAGLRLREGGAAEAMAMRLFLADRGSLVDGPWASMSDSDKRPYVEQARDLLTLASDYLTPSATKGVEVVFRDSPQPELGQFVEVQTTDGKRVTLGQWIRRGEGWVLSIPQLTIANTKPSKLSLHGSWLVDEAGECTCGSPAYAPCEPECGVEPVGNLAELPGWEGLVEVAAEWLVHEQRVDLLTQAAAHGIVNRVWEQQQ